ncbi:Gypsy retrotransposon integrase-like protein 1, partial [Mucuna pruriens]
MIIVKTHQKSIIHESIDQPTIEEPKVGCIEERTTWMSPLMAYLRDKRKPEDLIKAKKLIKEATKYIIIGGELYRRGFSFPLLKCIEGEEAHYMIKEVHERLCNSHIGGWALAGKIARAGYYWPTLKGDCMDYVRRCDKCQRFIEVGNAPPKQLHAITSPWPFHKWGTDILGPFPPAPRQVKYLIVAVDYFTKWIEVEPIATISTERIKRFYWKKIICRFDFPVEIDLVHVTGDGRLLHPIENQATFHISQASPNQQISRGSKQGHPERTSQAAGRSKGKMGRRTPPIISVEIWESSQRTALFQSTENEDEIRVNLDLLQEVKEYAAKVRATRQQRQRLAHRHFQPHDLVLRKITRTTDDNKLTPIWKGPYRITEEASRGAYHLEHLDGKKIPRTWNAMNLRAYHS